MVSGVQLFCMGIIGQYLSKAYLEGKERPIYISKEELKKYNNILSIDSNYIPSVLLGSEYYVDMREMDSKLKEMSVEHELVDPLAERGKEIIPSGQQKENKLNMKCTAISFVLKALLTVGCKNSGENIAKNNEKSEI